MLITKPCVETDGGFGPKRMSTEDLEKGDLRLRGLKDMERKDYKRGGVKIRWVKEKQDKDRRGHESIDTTLNRRGGKKGLKFKKKITGGKKYVFWDLTSRFI